MERELIAAFGQPSDESMALLTDALLARQPSAELDAEIRANLMVLKRRDARIELANLGLTHLVISTREQQIELLAETNRAIARSQAKLD